MTTRGSFFDGLSSRSFGKRSGTVIKQVPDFRQVVKAMYIKHYMSVGGQIFRYRLQEMKILQYYGNVSHHTRLVTGFFRVIVFFTANFLPTHRPFHTACLAAVIQGDKHDRRWATKITLQSLFAKEGEAFLSKILGGNDSSSGSAADQPGNTSSIDFTSYSRIAACRSMGMDEEYTGFLRLLSLNRNSLSRTSTRTSLGCCTSQSIWTRPWWRGYRPGVVQGIIDPYFGGGADNLALETEEETQESFSLSVCLSSP